MEFGYWRVKGLIEPIRWLFRYLDLEVKEYNPSSFEEWAQKKPSIGGFPNLPYIKDGDFILTETSAIPIYLIKKAGREDLLGKTIQDQAVLFQIDSVLRDIKDEYLKVLILNEGHQEHLGKINEKGTPVYTKFEQISAFLGEKDYLLGYLTWIDLYLAFFVEKVSVYNHANGAKGAVEDFPNIVNHSKRIKTIPKISDVVKENKALPFVIPGTVKFKATTSEEYEANIAK